jgi:hypothetical protein
MTPPPDPGRPDFRPPALPAPWYRRPAVFYVVAAVAVAGWLAVRSGLTPIGSGAGAAPDAAETVTTAAAAAHDPLPERAAAETDRRARLALAVVARRQVTDLGDDVDAAAAEAASDLDRWDAEVETLLTGDAGRPVACRPESVRAFRAVYDLDRPTRPEFERLQSLAAAALEPVRKAASDDAWADAGGTAAALTRLRDEARTRRDALRAARRRVDLVVQASRRDAGPVPAGGPTLQDAVRALDEREAGELAAAIGAAREEARLAVQARLAAGAAEAVRLAGEAEARREAAKAEVARTKVELEAAALTAQAATDRLRAKSRTPEVLHALAVFTARGYAQPGQGGTGVFEKTDVFGPVSFTRLRTGGYLDPTPDGLKKLLRLGAEPSPANDRPKWKFNAFRLDQSNEGFLKQTQALLAELGPVLAEDGLLAR